MPINIKIFDNNIPITFNEFIDDNITKIHQKLFNNAIEKYCEENDMNVNDYKIIDIKNDENYLKPSQAILISKKELKRERINLTEYWNDNYIDSLQNTVFDDLLLDDESKKNIEIVYIDYVKGEVTFKNKFTAKEFKVPFDRINNNTEYKEQLENTFSKLYGGITR